MFSSGQTKAGLVLAFLLGLTDIAILAAFTGHGDKPPIAVVIVSVAVGVVTLGLVVPAWRGPTRALMLAIVGLRVLSAIGDIAAFGESIVVVAMSIIFLVLSVIDIYLLRRWLRKPSAVGLAAN